jgi:hypothetical protein
MTQGLSRRTVMGPVESSDLFKPWAAHRPRGRTDRRGGPRWPHGDGQSYRTQDPEWTPTYGSNDTFTMVDLLTTAGAEVLGQVRQAGVGDARVD